MEMEMRSRYSLGKGSENKQAIIPGPARRRTFENKWVGMLMQQELTVILLEQKQFVTLNPVQDYDYTQQIGTYIIDLFPSFTFSSLISILLFLVRVIVSNLTELLKMIAKCRPEPA